MLDMLETNSCLYPQAQHQVTWGDLTSQATLPDGDVIRVTEHEDSCIFPDKIVITLSLGAGVT